MLNLDQAINIFYKDNPQLFFIKESNYREAPPTLPPSTHKALEINEEEYQEFLAQLKGTNYDDTVVDMPAIEKKHKDENRILDVEEIKSVPTIGKNTALMKKIGLSLAIPVSVAMFALSYVQDKTSPDMPTPPAVTQQVQAAASDAGLTSQQQEQVKYFMTHEYDTNVDTSNVLDSVVEREGFSSLPYPDKKQWSIGNGTEVSRTHTGKTISKSEWKDLEEDFKSYSRQEKIDWLNRNYPDWKSDFYAKYNISDELQQNDPTNEISEETARAAAAVHLNQLIAEMEDIAKYDFSSVTGEKEDILKYWQYLPKNVKKAYLDLAYNMGKGFLNKFKNFHKAIALAGDILSKPKLTEQDIQHANVFFKEAANQLLYNYSPVEVDDEGHISGGEQTGKTKYHADLQSSGRPQENADLIRQGIRDYKLYLEPVNFQNESLKKVYKHLFV